MDGNEAQTHKPPLTQSLVDAFAEQVRTRSGLARFDVFLSGTDIELGLLVVPKSCRNESLGSQAVRHLCRFADQYDRRVILSPALRGDAHGTTSRTRLVRFYKRFGFVENKGRQRDFAVSAGMFRLPKPARTLDALLQADEVSSIFTHIAERR